MIKRVLWMLLILIASGCTTQIEPASLNQVSPLEITATLKVPMLPSPTPVVSIKTSATITDALKLVQDDLARRIAGQSRRISREINVASIVPLIWVTEEPRCPPEGKGLYSDYIEIVTEKGERYELPRVNKRTGSPGYKIVLAFKGNKYLYYTFGNKVLFCGVITQTLP